MNRWTLLSLIFFTSLGTCRAWQDGDLVFHQSTSSQSQVIREVTGSRYTHMGMIVHLDSKAYVLEAIQPVSLTPVEQFIARGVGGHFVVKRVRRGFSEDETRRMKRLGRSWLGLNYDLPFAWDDREMYCSELVWKLIHRCTGLRVGEPQKFGDLDLRGAGAKRLIQARRRRVDPAEKIITPVAMFNSELLVTVEGP